MPGRVLRGPGRTLCEGRSGQRLPAACSHSHAPGLRLAVAVRKAVRVPVADRARIDSPATTACRAEPAGVCSWSRVSDPLGTDSPAGWSSVRAVPSVPTRRRGPPLWPRDRDRDRMQRPGLASALAPPRGRTFQRRLRNPCQVLAKRASPLAQEPERPQPSTSRYLPDLTSSKASGHRSCMTAALKAHRDSTRPLRSCPSPQVPLTGDSQPPGSVEGGRRRRAAPSTGSG